MNVTILKAIECLNGLATGEWKAWGWPGEKPDCFVPIDAYGQVINGGPVMLEDLLEMLINPSEGYAQLALEKMHEARESAARNKDTAPELASFANGVDYACEQLVIEIRKIKLPTT